MNKPAQTLAMTLCCWVGVAVLTGMAGCGGGSGGGCGGSPVEPPVPNPPREGALAASKPGELMNYVRTKLDARATEIAKNPGMVFMPAIGSELTVGFVTTAGATSATGVERSGTTVQEQGVDEDDLLKTDGSVLYTLTAPPELFKGQNAAVLKTFRRRADGGIDAAGSLATIVEPDAVAVARGMLLAAPAQRVAVLGQSQQFLPYDFCNNLPVCTMPALPFVPQYAKPTVHLDLINVSNATTPVLAERVRIDGRLIGARLIGNVLYVVTQHTPQLALEALPATATKAERDALLARLTATDVLPTIRIGSAAATPLLADTDCYVQAKNTALGIDITSVTAIDLAAGTSSRASRCFVGGSEALYMSTTSLYLATTRSNYVVAPLIRFPATMTTDIHKFTLAGLTVNYRGSGEVPGHLGWDPARKSYRMSEFNGDLRVLSFTGETGWLFLADATTAGAPPASPATLSVLRERTSDQSLQVVGKLPNERRPAAIGKPGEQVYAVRFLGNRGYVVTFRRTDPLYVLDLADATDPKTVGELETPGFSDYLLPLANNLLLGVGRDADARGFATGAKISLYDVANPAAPREVTSRVFGAAGSGTGLESSSHGIDLFTRGNLTRVGLPLRVIDARGFITARGLQKIEIDTNARSMSVKALLPASDGVTNWDLSRERSVQIQDHVYYLSGVSLTASSW
jgi:Beta propeller domain